MDGTHKNRNPNVFGLLAQLVEHIVHIDGVTGSSPVQTTKPCWIQSEKVESSFLCHNAARRWFTRLWHKKHGLIADGFFPEVYYPNSDTPYMELWIPFRQRGKQYEPEELP